MSVFQRSLMFCGIACWAVQSFAQQAMPAEDRRMLRQQMREQWQSQGEYRTEYRREEVRQYREREEGSWRQLPPEERRQIRESMREQSYYREYDREHERHDHRRRAYPENGDSPRSPRW